MNRQKYLLSYYLRSISIVCDMNIYNYISDLCIRKYLCVAMKVFLNEHVNLQVLLVL